MPAKIIGNASSINTTKNATGFGIGPSVESGAEPGSSASASGRRRSSVAIRRRSCLSPAGHAVSKEEDGAAEESRQRHHRRPCQSESQALLSADADEPEQKDQRGNPLAQAADGHRGH